MPRKHPSFASLSDAQWSRLEPHIQTHAYEANQAIDPEGATQNLYWLAEGSVELSCDTPFGPQLVAEMNAPNSFGECALIDENAVQTKRHTTTPAVLHRISLDTLKELFEQDKGLATHFFRAFWPALAHKLVLANKQLKQFFKQGPPTPASLPAVGRYETPDRPAWFTPPETPPTSSASLDGVATGLTDKQRHAALQNLGLSSSEIDVLFERGEEYTVAKKAAIFREGEFGDTLYFILQGQVRISKSIPTIGEEALAILEPGDIFGEMALVASNAIRSADSFAHNGPAVLLAFRLHVLWSMKGHPEELAFLGSLCKMMAHRVRESYGKLVSWQMMRGGFF